MKLPNKIPKHLQQSLWRGSGTCQGKIAFALIALISAVSVLTSVVLQYGFGVKLCQLCYYERYVYVAALCVMGIFGLLFRTNGPQVVKGVFLMGLFILGFCLSVYHVAVELHWVALPRFCGGGEIAAHSLQELKQAVLETEHVPCDRVPVRIFGYSLASWNVVLSGFLVLLSIGGSLCFFKRWQDERNTKKSDSKA